MQTGRFNKRIQILEEVRTSDGMGGTSSFWKVLDTRYADFLPKSGREKVQAGQVVNPVEAIFRVRYTTAVKEEHRIRYNGQIWEVKSLINMEGKNIELEIGVNKVIE